MAERKIMIGKIKGIQWNNHGQCGKIKEMYDPCNVTQRAY